MSDTATDLAVQGAAPALTAAPRLLLSKRPDLEASYLQGAMRSVSSHA